MVALQPFLIEIIDVQEHHGVPKDVTIHIMLILVAAALRGVSHL